MKMKHFQLILAAGFCFLFPFSFPAWTDGDRELAAREFLNRIDKPTRLIQEAAQACWSPDGLQIACSYMPGGEDRMNGGGILILSLGNPTPRRVTADGKDPAWSPDGQWIAYVRAGYENMRESIWLVRADGSNRPQFIAEGGYPQWKPGSRALIYHSRQTNRVCQALFESGLLGKREILFDVAYDYPRLSPDGNEIAYLLPSLQSFFLRNNSKRAEYILVVSDLKKNLHHYRVVPFNFFLGQWSPNGEWIAFGGFLNRSPGLYRIKSDLSAPAELILKGNWGRPAWSPDGRYLAFDPMENGKLELWLSHNP